MTERGLVQARRAAAVLASLLLTRGVIAPVSDPVRALCLR